DCLEASVCWGVFLPAFRLTRYETLDLAISVIGLRFGRHTQQLTRRRPHNRRRYPLVARTQPAASNSTTPCPAMAASTATSLRLRADGSQLCEGQHSHQ